MPKLKPVSASPRLGSLPPPYRWGALLLVGLGLWYVVAAALLPVSQDEAYYIAWGRYLDFGYFDHPPLVAWLTAASAYAPKLLWLNGRLATLLLTLATFVVLLHFFHECGLRGRHWLAATLLLLFNVGSLIAGLITTPDVGLLFCWALALHEGAVALSRDPRRWLGVGVAVGVGLLSKYTMLLIGPVFLITALQISRQTLRSPWTYAGVLLAFLIYTPNLLWNHEQGYVTWKFQLRHGFGLERNGILGSALPPPLAPQPGGREQLLAARMQSLDAASGSLEPLPVTSEPSAWRRFWLDLTAPVQPYLKALSQLFEYLASQLIFWGALLLPLLWQAWRLRPLRAGQQQNTSRVLRPLRHSQARRDVRESLGPSRRGEAPTGDSHSTAALDGSRPAAGQRMPSPALPLAPLLKTASVVPVVTFAVISLTSRVEANWSAMYLLAAAPWLASLLPTPNLKALGKAAGVNLLLVIALLVHAAFPFLPIKPQNDRLLKETHGYEALSRTVAKLNGPVFADSYQIVALLNLYLPSRQVQQWPGITRPSEFLRRPAMAPLNYDSLAAMPGFWLVTTDDLPPRLPHFSPQTLSRFDDCRQGYLQEQTLEDVMPTLASMQDARQAPIRLPCKRLHRWYVIYYTKEV